MDFSSVKRAIESLQRRKPSVSTTVLSYLPPLLHYHNDEHEVTSEEYKKVLLQLLKVNDNRWESLAVGLYLGECHLEEMTNDIWDNSNAKKNKIVYVDGPRVPSIVDEEEKASSPAIAKKKSASPEESTAQFCNELLQTCKIHLQHSEPRVRTLVAKTVGSHARYASTIQQHSSSYTPAFVSSLQSQRLDIHSTILSSLQDNIQKGRDESTQHSRDSTGAMDDTTGWRSLETNLQTLASYANGCATFYLLEKPWSVKEERNTEEWKEFCNVLEHCANVHVNRHVRAASIATLEVLIHCCEEGDVVRHIFFEEDEGSEEESDEDEEESVLKTTIVQVLKVCLADNWSQVRMAASVLCRKFFITLIKEQQKHSNDDDEDDIFDSFYPALLPRMCLNRFYLAQGVKLYSHDTWKIIFERKGNGLQMVAKNAASICRYYVKMCDADNHVVREAACQAVAELAQKIGTHEEYAELLAPFVPMLLQVRKSTKKTQFCVC